MAIITETGTSQSILQYIRYRPKKKRKSAKKRLKHAKRRNKPMLNDIASNTSFFGIFITGVVYVLACAIQKRFKSSILNPLLVSCVILIIFMLVSGIDYNVYLYGKPKADGTYDGTGAIFFQNMLTPTTVCLAIPLYEKLV